MTERAPPVPSIIGAPFADGAPGQHHFARAVVANLSARNAPLLAAQAAPGAADRLTALLAAPDDWAVRAAAGSRQIQIRTDGNQSLAAFADLEANQLAVISMRLGPDGRMCAEGIWPMPATDFTAFGRPL